jgi:hypothetical protein
MTYWITILAHTPCQNNQWLCLDLNQVLPEQKSGALLVHQYTWYQIIKLYFSWNPHLTLCMPLCTYVKIATAEEVITMITIVFVSVVASGHASVRGKNTGWAGENTGYRDQVFSWFFSVLQVNAWKIPQLGQDPFLQFTHLSNQHHKNFQPPKMNKEQASGWNINNWRVFKEDVSIIFHDPVALIDQSSTCFISNAT